MNFMHLQFEAVSRTVKKKNQCTIKTLKTPLKFKCFQGLPVENSLSDVQYVHKADLRRQ